MIGHFCEVMVRAFLGAVGFRISERKLGVCGGCYCGVWEGDELAQVDGLLFHKDCAADSFRGRA